FIVFFMVISCSNAAETKYMIVQVPAEEQEKTYSVNVLNNIICKEFRSGDARAYFKEGAEDIPYVNIEQLCNNFTTVEYPEKYKVKITSNNNNYTSTALIDLTKRKIYFSNYDHYMSQFYGGSSKKTFFDLANVKENDFIKIEKSFNSWGAPIEVNFSGFEDFVLCAEIDGKLNYYVSLNTFGNLFTNGHYVYNGKEVYSRNEIIYNIVNKEEFYRFDEGTGKKMRSSALTDFTYNELCINLDLNYGLKELHGNKFDCFDSYFEYVGLKSKLLDPDPEIFCKAIWDLCHAYFSDNHSIFMLASYYCGYDIAKKFAERVETGDENLLMGGSFGKKVELYNTARQNAYGENIPGLEFSDDGKTAIVRFDKYTSSGASDLNAIINETNQKLRKTTDEICELIKTNYTAIQDYIVKEYYLYCVNKMIKENPGVENVILDMSNNTGGTCRTAVATLAWMLGEVQTNITNSITGAKCSSVYVCDINADGTFDEKDTIKDKKLFCLISPASFSCGNMVPAMLKSSDRVVLLGETSGGGSACVYPTMAADSTTFRISSRYVLSENKNGSNYDIDKGIEPHVRLQPETLYNRKKICSIVANMK
ncbi:MAG: S41 family peptidase, partial [Treponema sp.]|nr:S41 family peptidase [Treponema sp.]